MTPPPALSHELLASVEQVSALCGEWDALLARSRCNRAFGSSTWFLAVCRLFPVHRPCVYVVRRSGALAGVLPLVRCEGGEELRFPTFLNDYNDAVVADGDLEAAARLLELAAADGALRLARLRGDSCCVRGFQALGLREELQDREVCPYIRLPAGPAEYFGSKSKAFRKEYGRARRQAQAGGVAVQELTPASLPPADLPETFLALHRARFSERSGFRGEEAQRFVRLALPVLFAQGRLRVFALIAGDQMLGIDLCMVGPEGLCTWNGGFRPDAARWAPGKLFFDGWLRESYAMGSRELDLMRGGQPWKLRCATDSREIGRLEIRRGRCPPPGS